MPYRQLGSTLITIQRPWPAFQTTLSKTGHHLAISFPDLPLSPESHLCGGLRYKVKGDELKVVVHKHTLGTCVCA